MSKIIHCDDRGYCLTITDTGQYIAGCRDFSRAEALAHWGDPQYPDTERGQGFVQSILAGAEIAELPAGLRWLYLSGATTLPAEIVLPEGLRGLTLSGGATLPAEIVLPEGLQWLYLYGGATLPAEIVLPEGLQGLYLYRGATLPAGIVLPAGCTVI